MYTPEPEQDSNLLLGAGVQLANAEDGQLLANALKADEFDARHQNDVEGLLFLGFLTHEAQIFGHSFVLKTLTRGERLAATQVMQEYEDTLGAADALGTAFVAAALVSVDGRSLWLPLEESVDRNPLIRIRAQFEHVNRWYDPIIEALYAEFGTLILRQASAFAALSGNLSASRVTR